MGGYNNRVKCPEVFSYISLMDRGGDLMCDQCVA